MRDYSNESSWKWYLRRVVIGLSLMLYSLLSVGLVTDILTPRSKTEALHRRALAQQQSSSAEIPRRVGPDAQVGESDAMAAEPGRELTTTVRTEGTYRSVDKKADGSNGFGDKIHEVLSERNSQQLGLMASFGVLGSLFYMIWAFVRTTNRVDFPVAWYITRPILGALMAWFLYFAAFAGQLVFYSANTSDIAAKAESINIYSLAILAIVAGVFTEHAYEVLRAFAFSLLKSRPTSGGSAG
jgi:hypothetical protein